MIDAQLLEMLRCPDDHSTLSPAEPETIDRINRAIESGQATNIGGQQLKKKIDGGLVRAANDLLYPVIDNIPVMLPDEAIALSQFQ